ncbi:MAG: phospholipid carrier-dependent glycosyltransferase, partial [Thermoplasmatales archaeon]|nr:phospholipid carrier-dependent glycosyltransferase [Thermoplasmatales archaeon]
MRFIRDLKPKGLLKNWVFWLILITVLAIIIRSIPSWLHAAWGCDFGIYYGITKSVAQSGVLFPPYTGWGSSYNEFPLLYLINAFASWITGIDVLTIMPKLTPIFGGLSVLVFYFLAYELTKNKKIAMLSTLFFAVLPFHVYQTSHASPLTIGHFFMVLSLYLFLRYRQNTKYVFPLL